MEKILKFFRFSNPQNNLPDTNKTLVLHVVNSDGRVIRLETLSESMCAEVISASLEQLSEQSENVYKGHQLFHIRTRNVINYNTTMESAGVADNDEMCLLKRLKILKENTEINHHPAPTQEMIDKITDKVPSSSEASPNIKVNFVRLNVGGHSYIRNFLIQMAIESAYIISAGPYADFLIEYFKLKIIGWRKQYDNAVKSLMELGFENERCTYAMKLKKGIYSEALSWLIDHDEDSNTYHSYNSSISLIGTIYQFTPDKFNRLAQIIRIYGRCGQQYCEKVLKTFSEMGFDESISLNALKKSDWDPSKAIELLSENPSGFVKNEPSIAKNVLESADVQTILGDPEIFMTIVYILGSGTGSSGIENNWESTKKNYRHIAFVLKTFNAEKHYDIMNNIN